MTSTIRRQTTSDRQDSSSEEDMLARRGTTALQSTEPIQLSSFACGLLAGVLQAGLFNPYDRALFLSINEQRHFLDSRNWQNPYRGILTSLGTRAVSGGLYFPVEHAIVYEMPDDYRFLAGSLAGAVNATLIHPLTALKYKTWQSQKTTRTLVHSMVSHGVFFRGLTPTLLRDIAFGGTYTYVRSQLPFSPSTNNFVAAALATIVSGPLNYVRNIHLGTPSAAPVAHVTQILRDLGTATRGQPAPVRFLCSQLRIGWGTARVALGITFGQWIYDGLHRVY